MTDLTEEVARALAVADGHDADEMRGRLDVDGKWPVWHAYRGQAQAAIAIVLERAAEVARDKADEFNHQEAMATCDDWRSGYWTGRAESGRAILALSPNRSREG